MIDDVLIHATLYKKKGVFSITRVLVSSKPVDFREVKINTFKLRIRIQRSGGISQPLRSHTSSPHFLSFSSFVTQIRTQTSSSLRKVVDLKTHPLYECNLILSLNWSVDFLFNALRVYPLVRLALLKKLVLWAQIFRYITRSFSLIQRLIRK